MVFVLTGGFAALANFFSRIAFNEFTDFETSVILAFFVGITTGYLLSRIFVFKEFNGSHYQSFFWFVIVNLIALLQTYGISVGLYSYVFPWFEYTFYTASTAHAIGIAFPVFTSYIGHKYLSFRNKK